MFEEGDYVVRKVGSIYLWQVWQVETVESVMKQGVVPPIGDRLTLKPICTLEGGGVPDAQIKQQGWEAAFEPPNPLLLLALVSRHETPFSG